MSSLSPPGNSPKCFFPKISNDGVCDVTSRSLSISLPCMNGCRSRVHFCVDPCSLFILCTAKKKDLDWFITRLTAIPWSSCTSQRAIYIYRCLCFLVIISCAFGFVLPLSWNSHKMCEGGFCSTDSIVFKMQDIFHITSVFITMEINGVPLKRLDLLYCLTDRGLKTFSTSPPWMVIHKVICVK